MVQGAATSLSEGSPAGSMMLAANGMTMIAPPDGNGGAYHNHYLYDSYNSTFTVPVNVFRAVDGRIANDLSPSGQPQHIDQDTEGVPDSGEGHDMFGSALAGGDMTGEPSHSPIRWLNH